MVIGVFEKKMLRKIYGTICVNEEYRRKINHELYQLYPDIKIHRVRWLNMTSICNILLWQERCSKATIAESAEGKIKTPVKYQVEEDVKNLVIANWRTHAENRSAWRSFIGQVKIKKWL